MLIRCPECDKEVSDVAKTCPHCGFPLEIIENVEPKKQNNDGVYYARPTQSLTPRDKKANGKRTLFWIVLVVIAMFAGCGACVGSSDKEQPETEEEFDTNNKYVEYKKDVQKETVNEESTIDPEITTQAVTEVVDEFESELEEYNNGQYKYITPCDLSKYHANLEGMKFYTVAEVNEFEDSVIQITLDDGYMMSSFNCKNDYSDKIQEEQSIAIMGIVGEYNDYGVMGKSIEFNDCMVFAVGENTKQYDLGVSDESFSEFFVVNEKVADTNNNITEEEYKSICEKLDYKDILRNPDSYNDTYCIIEGKASQIIEGWFGSYTIYVDDNNGNTWGCVYSYKDGESHLLEGDSVKIYGECNGTSTTETVLGKQVMLPYIEVKYIN